MPDTLPPDVITRFLIDASAELSAEGPKSAAFAARLRDVAPGSELHDLLVAKLGVANPPGWFGRLLGRVSAVGEAPVVRHVLGFFGTDYQAVWKLIVTALAGAMAFLHVPGCPSKSAPPADSAPPFPPHVGDTRTQSYYRSRYQMQHVERAAAAPAIDGRLGDWNPAGFFTAACDGELGRHHYLLGAMRADDQHLYLAAVVGDPFPLRNAVPVDPAAATEPQVWQGGAVHVYLALRKIDPGTAMPADPEQKKDKQLVRLTLWCAHPDLTADGVPRLMVSHTMNDGSRKPGEFRVAADGQFAAAYVPLADGRTGYALEYRIPWATVTGGEARMPFPRETLTRGCWEVHWSDAAGTAFRGKLVDVVNAANELHAPEHAEAWGELAFHAAPRD